MAKAAKVNGGGEPVEGAERSTDGNVSFLLWSLSLFDAADRRDLSPVAELLRDPTVALTQEDRNALAELLCPVKQGAKVRAKLIGRGGRGGKGGTAERDDAFYEALQAHRIASGSRRIPAEVMAEIAAQHGLLSVESAKSAETRGRKLSHARWLASHPDEV